MSRGPDAHGHQGRLQARVERVREVLTDVAHADHQSLQIDSMPVHLSPSRQTLSGVEHVELITEGPQVHRPRVGAHTSMAALIAHLDHGGR
jgi:hypothetical protein